MEILIFTTITAVFTVAQALPVEVSDAVVDKLWKTASIEAWPEPIRPSPHIIITSQLTPVALAVAPTENFKFDSVVLQIPNFETMQLFQRNKYLQINTPTYIENLALPSISLPLLSAEMTGKLIHKARAQNHEGIAEKISKKPTSVGISLLDVTKGAKKQFGMNIPATDRTDFKSDVRLLKAVQEINPEFVIEEVISVPGQHILSAMSSQKDQKPFKLSTVSLAPPELKSKSTASPKKPSALRKANPSLSVPKATDGEIKVEAQGHTATSGAIREIPFGAYFLPYQAHTQKDITKTSTLILEPHSKAVVGNGGTAVSTPISKAFLQRGVPTNVYFSPESIAIAGVGGKAHAQADLELDLVDLRK